ncbi:serine/threonine-protein kinase [Actinoplanes sp. NBRC 101535]|uniref:serine/threonine-protein kinase n=1 Tax=Actinoplanes sp. NBRC 101535 TaxID=3032196 RepID=UPI0024A5197E|nr:serine/threonine-protein kinase [Actinoplanes sp. NBRC 101535]GLY05743.1 hypothetical protein Acsp01_61220 [Actinoplanes sp. NBRC 101535]
MDQERCVGNSYRLIRPIGQGATGTVWQGEDRSTGEPVAIKLLHDSLLRQPRLVTRFVQERTILLMLRHQNVVRVRDLFSAGDSLGLVMDLVAGGSLRDHLNRRRALPPAEAARLAGQVASALAEAHEMGIIHRDLKPDNILLSREENGLEARLTDFGIARILTLPSITTPAAVVGTPHYMAPEAFHGATPSAATDVYSLGVLLYELVCGCPPYRSDSLPELMRLHSEGAAERRPGIPDNLWQIITACLSSKPRRRPGAAELATELTELTAELSSAGPSHRADITAAAARPPVPRSRRNDAPRGRWTRPGAAAALVAGILVAVGAAWQVGRSESRLESSPPVIITASVAPVTAVVPRPAAPRPPTSKPAVKRKAATARSSPSAVRATRSAATRIDVRSPVNRDEARNSWQCTPDMIFDLPTRSPLGLRPCHFLGRDVRVQATLTTPAKGRGRIEVRLLDTASGRTVAGPATCDDLRFSRRELSHGCGPLTAQPRRGRTYAVQMSYRFSRDGHESANTVRGRPFRW